MNLKTILRTLPALSIAITGISLMLSLSSCEPPDELSTDVNVYTEEIVFTSGESAIMTGRVLAQGAVQVTDHGFHIDTTDAFLNPIVISLGERNIPGRFVGEVHELNIRNNYYCRAYLVENGETITGNVLSFATVSPQVLDFSPKEGISGTPITIEGVNLTADAKILWNNLMIPPQQVIAEALLPFNAPPLSDDPTITIRVVAQGDTLSLAEQFEYIIGTWTQLAELDDNERNQRHVYFEDGNNFVYGLGIAMGHMTSALHSMNKSTYQRITYFLPSSPTEGAFFSNGYFGGGSLQKVTSPVLQLDLSQEFWHFSNGNFTKLADVPVELYKAAAIENNGKVYVYGGERPDRSRNQLIWVYDEATDSWDFLNPAPFSQLGSLPHFRIGNYHYFITEDAQTWRHDPTADSWQRLADYPGQVDEYGVALVLDGNAYVGMQGASRKLYVYRPGSDTWRSKAGFLEMNPFYTIGGWAADGHVYVIRMQSVGDTNRLLWQLDPEAF